MSTSAATARSIGPQVKAFARQGLASGAPVRKISRGQVPSQGSLEESFGRPGFLSESRPEIEDIHSIPQRPNPSLFFCRYRQTKAYLGFLEPTPLADRIMVSIELRALGPTEVFRDGRHIIQPATEPGALALYDLRQSWAAYLRDPFDNLSMFLPVSTFQQLAAERNQTFLELRFDVRDKPYDEVMQSLTRAILPALARPRGLSRLYLDHVFLAVREHLAATYGAFAGNPRRDRRGLTNRQIRSAQEYIEAHVGDDISLAGIARASGVSISSLTRGFRAALNVSPHQWVLSRRIALAQRLISAGKTPLSEIAVLCGFADQSHLARVFLRHVGASPGVWRRSVQR
jgi:AraC-like DNA-binding protein